MKPEIVAPAADIIGTQAAAMPMAEEVGYVYQRADGTIERALNIEDAILRCPVLGKLAIESPEQAKVLLDLAAADPRTVETKKSVETQTSVESQKVDSPTAVDQQPIVKTVVPKPIETKQRQHEQTKVRQIELPKLAEPPTSKKEAENPSQAVKVVHDASDIAKIMAIAHAQQELKTNTTNQTRKIKAASTRQNNIAKTNQSIDTMLLQSRQLDNRALEQVKSEVKSATPVDTTARPIVEASAPAGIKVEITLENLEDEAILQQRPNPRHTPKPSEAALSLSTTITEPESEHGNSRIELDTIDEPLYASAIETATLIDSNIAPVITSERDVTEVADDTPDTESTIVKTEIQYIESEAQVIEEGEAPELSELYELRAETSEEMLEDSDLAEIIPDQQLEQLFDPETVETYKQLAALAESSEIEDLEESETIADDASTNHSRGIETKIADFESFMTSRPQSNEVPSLEIIAEHANEQPLEQTLMELTDHLSQIEEIPEKAEVYKIIAELRQLLPARPEPAPSSESDIKPKITPEITTKTLSLLRSLGYKEPGKVLVTFVSKYGENFFIEALDYVCQLNDYLDKEFLLVSNKMLPDDNNSRQRLGRLVMEIVMKFRSKSTLYLSQATSGLVSES